MMKNHAMLLLSVLTPSMALLFAREPAREPLPLEYGQKLVSDAFTRESFYPGSWSNDVSCLINCQWRIYGKGIYTYFSAAEHLYSDGRAWQLWEISSGKLLPCKYDWSPDVDIWFVPDQLFEIEYNDGRRMIVFHNDRRIGAECPNRGEEVTLVSQKWFALSVTTNGAPRKALISVDGANALFCNKSMKSICCAIPHMYHGAKAEIRNEETREQKRLRESEASINAWKLAKTQKERVAQLHQQYLHGLMTSAITTNVFIIACDGNMDGIVDAYVSSDVESDLHDHYKWSLYIGDGMGFSRADKTVKFVFDRIEAVKIEPVVYARNDAFFRVDRIGIPSYVMPITDEGEFWSYFKHDSPVKSFRAKPGMQDADFYCCIDNGTAGITTGIASLSDIFLMHSMLVSANRLHCETIVVSPKGSPE